MKLTSLFIFLTPIMLWSQAPTKSGKYKQYITKNQDTIKVGDTITLGLPYNGSQYLFITQGNQPAAAHISGDTVVISKIKAIGNQKRGFKMYAFFKGYGLPVAIQIDQALKTDEIEL